MSFIHRNIAAFFIFVLVASLGWIYGGTMTSVIRPILPWLIVIMYEIALCFPQRRDGESTGHARKRVWKSLRRDPLSWVVFAFMLILSVPFVNVGNPPDIKLIPFCADAMKHYGVFLWFASALSAALLAKHSLTRSGKRTLVEMIIWNGAAMAVFGFVQLVAEAPGPLWSTLVKNPGHFFSTFGYPNMAGDYFTVLFCLSIGHWRDRLDDIRHNLEGTHAAKRMSKHKLFWKKHYLLIAALLNFFAALNTLSRAAIILVSASAILLFAHAGIVALFRMNKVERVKVGAFYALAILIMAAVATVFMPDGVHREMKTIDSREALDRVTGRGESHSIIATQIWREHLLFGCGGWGYAIFCVEKQPRRTYWAPGSANVHNDHLQFLVEHGLVGYGMLVAVVVLLLIPIGKSWITIANGVRFLATKRQKTPSQSFFALPGSAFSLLVAAAVPIIHAFGDCPLRSPAVLTLFYVTLACVPGYLPREEYKMEES